MAQLGQTGPRSRERRCVFRLAPSLGRFCDGSGAPADGGPPCRFPAGRSALSAGVGLRADAYRDRCHRRAHRSNAGRTRGTAPTSTPRTARTSPRKGSTCFCARASSEKRSERRPGDPILILLREWIVVRSSRCATGASRLRGSVPRVVRGVITGTDRVSRVVVLGHVLDLLLLVLVLNAHQAEGLDAVWLSTSAVPGLGCPRRMPVSHGWSARWRSRRRARRLWHRTRRFGTPVRPRRLR